MVHAQVIVPHFPTLRHSSFFSREKYLTDALISEQGFSDGRLRKRERKQAWNAIHGIVIDVQSADGNRDGFAIAEMLI